MDFNKMLMSMAHTKMTEGIFDSYWMILTALYQNKHEN